MKRRDFLYASGIALGASFLPSFGNNYAFGWLGGDSRHARKLTRWQIPLRNEYQTVLLYKFYEQQAGKPLEPHSQMDVGDCVGHAWAVGIDLLSAVQASKPIYRQTWKGKQSPEVIYAGSRVEIGNFHDYPDDGSNISWAAEYVGRYGSLLRGVYGEHNMTTYDRQRSRQWGHSVDGVPRELEGHLRPVRSTTAVQSWEDIRNAVINGYPVVLGTFQAFKPERDKDGFAKLSDERWAHAMCCIGVDNDPVRPGALLINSWGKWGEGPKRFDQPDGSFWVDAHVIDNIVKSQSDNFAMSQYNGFPCQKLNYKFLTKV